jgi:hypothetical protein
MATQPKRLPICGTLSFVASAGAWLLLYWMYRPPTFLRDNTGHIFFFSLMLLYACGFCGFVLAVLALALHEQIWILPVFALLLDLSLAEFFIWAMVMLGLQGGRPVP